MGTGTFFTFSIFQIKKKVPVPIFHFPFSIFCSDEWSQIHEAVNPYSGRLLQSFSIDVKSSLWELPLFSVYGILALLIWAYWRDDLSRSEQSLTFIWTGIIFLAIGVFLDTAGSGWLYMSIPP